MSPNARWFPVFSGADSRACGTTPGELLDGGDVDDPIVQVVHQLRHAQPQEGLVRMDGVSGQGGLLRLGTHVFT